MWFCQGNMNIICNMPSNCEMDDIVTEIYHSKFDTNETVFQLNFMNLNAVLFLNFYYTLLNHHFPLLCTCLSVSCIMYFIGK